MLIVHPVIRFAITFFLALLAVACAAVVAFGTHPALARYPAGLDWITLSRRLQWPLTTGCLILCLALIAQVVVGKRRAAWLLILAPVLFLFYQRFAGDPFRRMAILDNPAFVGVEKASFLKPESPVIGLVFEGQPYCYPTGCLALAPVIAHADADKRLLVMYSPYAGRAQAFVVDNTVKPRELDIVSMPANALLLYNSRIGQFINAFTGATLKGERPEGFKTPIETRKTTWREWRTQYPDTKVLATALSPVGEKITPRFPNRPVKLDLPADARVALLATANPVALQLGKVGGGTPPPEWGERTCWSSARKLRVSSPSSIARCRGICFRNFGERRFPTSLRSRWWIPIPRRSGTPRDAASTGRLKVCNCKR